MNRRLFLLLTDKRAQRLSLLVALWVPAVVALFAVREVLLPFLLAVALAYVILPPVRWLSSLRLPAAVVPRALAGRRMPRWLAVIVLYSAIVVAIVGGGRVFVPQVYKELTRLGRESSAAFTALSDANIAQKAASLEAWVEEHDLPIRIITAEDDEGDPAPAVGSDAILKIDLVGATQDGIRRVRAMALERAMKLVSEAQVALAALVRFVFSGLLVFMLAAFLVADSERIVSFLFTLTPMRDRAKLEDLLDRIDRGLSGVVRGQLTICLINGVLTLIGLLLLKVKFAFLLATVAAVFSLVPIFGSILSTIPIVIVALSSGLTTAVLAVLWIVGIHLIEANLLNPKIMGDAAKIHPVLVVLALVVGEHFWGLTGALFAVPITSIFVTVWKAMRARAMALDEEIAQHEARQESSAPVRRPVRRLSVDGG